MKPATVQELIWAGVLVALAAFWPMMSNGYWLGIGVDVMMYTALATSWMLFSGPTHYISLASAAFFGVGGFVVGSGMSDYDASFWSMLALSAVIGGVLAALIGLATLRLSGVYFVIFTLGLAEMIRNLGELGSEQLPRLSRPLCADGLHRYAPLYWMLLVTAASVYLSGLDHQPFPPWLCAAHHRRRRNRRASRRHQHRHGQGDPLHNHWRSSQPSSAPLSPRGGVYIEPNQVFSPQLSFFVVIMALLGGSGRLWGPVVGVIPFLLIWNWVDSNFSKSVHLGARRCFPRDRVLPAARRCRPARAVAR